MVADIAGREVSLVVSRARLVFQARLFNTCQKVQMGIFGNSDSRRCPFVLFFVNMTTMEIISKSLKETEEAARAFSEKLAPQKDVATVVGLYGDLGSGKTTFVQSCAKFFGVREPITSPTFVLIKNYELQTKNYKLIIHIDAYRLEKGEELLKLGWREIAADPKNLIFIEWPENVADIIPADTKKISFKFIDENTREIEY
jgi:tRNA threonylcarbamoyladenosine biosynthesis protein TsaE